MNLKETFVKKLKIVRGNAVGFHIDRVKLPNNKTATREYLDHPGAVSVLALLDKKNAIMVRQYRHAVREITLEIPAGKLNKGEVPLSCIKRELIEETGYTAKKITKLLSYWPTAAFANEVIHIYLAEDLTPGPSDPDEDEFLSCEVWPLKKLYEMAATGKIKDSKTLIALNTYRLK